METTKVPREPISVRYYSKIAGSKFIFANGLEIFFNHGFFDLKENEHQEPFMILANKEDPRNGRRCFDVYKAELDDLIAKGNPLLFKQGTQPEPLPNIGAELNAKSEAEIAAQEAGFRNANIRVTGDVNAGQVAGVASDVNTSTVDPELRTKLLGPTPVAPAGADRLKQIRESAAIAAAVNTRTGSASGS